MINREKLNNLSNIEESLKKGINFCEECQIIIDDRDNIEISCNKYKLKKQFKFGNIKEIDNYISVHEILKPNPKEIPFLTSKIESFIQKARQKIDYKFEFIEKSLNYLDNLEKNEKKKNSI